MIESVQKVNFVQAGLAIALHTYVLQWPIGGELGKKFQTVTLESIHCV